MTADDKKTRLGPPSPEHGVRPATDAPSGRAAATAAAEAAVHSYLPGDPSVDPLIGQTLVDKYYVEKKLGEGGMGAVYLCQHVLLEKPVALKVLHGEFARKPDLVQRFMQEARAASKIRHDNVIDISDFGATPEGVVFFAMELLQGHDLHSEVGRAKMQGSYLPWERSISIYLQICSALAAAHARGIIHRDLKPENVYVVERGGRTDWVKLLDFGIAKLTELGEGEKKLTRTGMLFGTPEYMAPEQARGEAVDHRVDIYAMGCILYQLITSRVPFESDNFMGVLTMHLTSEPPAIPEAALAGSGAPRAIEAIVRRALAKDRDQRFASIDELARAVREASGWPAEDGSGVFASGAMPGLPLGVSGGGRAISRGVSMVTSEAIAVAATPSAKSNRAILFGALVVVVIAAALAALRLLGPNANEPAAQDSATVAPSLAPALPAAGAGPLGSAPSSSMSGGASGVGTSVGSTTATPVAPITATPSPSGEPAVPSPVVKSGDKPTAISSDKPNAASTKGKDPKSDGATKPETPSKSPSAPSTPPGDDDLTPTLKTFP